MPTAVRNIRLDDILDVTEHWVNIIHLNCGTVLRTKKNRGELKWTLFRIRQDYTQYHENWIHINRRGVSSYFLIAVSSTTKGPCTKIWPAVYSWIGRPVQTHKTSICRETERATYAGFEYTDEELSTRCIQWWWAKKSYFHSLKSYS